jgi:hypothetical protein
VARLRPDALIVEFPLRGEGWVAVNSPADRIPSHGTNMLGQRFAFDFIKVDGRRRLHVHPAGLVQTVLLGVPTRECYGWGAPVHAMLDGEVVSAVDGVEERRWVHPVRELFHAIKNAVTFTPDRLPSILGNHVLVRSGDRYAGYVHLAPGSVAVHVGQGIRAGHVIGRVGHTGNSTSPHLHVQLMDAADPTVAAGLPLAFRSYEVLRGGAWEPVEHGVPGKDDRVRVLGTS